VSPPTLAPSLPQSDISFRRRFTEAPRRYLVVDESARFGAPHDVPLFCIPQLVLQQGDGPPLRSWFFSMADLLEQWKAAATTEADYAEGTSKPRLENASTGQTYRRGADPLAARGHHGDADAVDHGPTRLALHPDQVGAASDWRQGVINVPFVNWPLVCQTRARGRGAPRRPRVITKVVAEVLRTKSRHRAEEETKLASSRSAARSAFKEYSILAGVYTCDDFGSYSFVSLS